MKCIIIEDQAPARRVIQKFVDDYGNLTLMGSFSSALEGLEFLKTNDVDLIFLDIHLPKLSGIDFIQSLTNPPSIILTTAFTEYAVQGYELNIVDYLVKPFSFERFVKAVNKVESRKKLQGDTTTIEDKVFFIKSGYDYIKVSHKDILYIQSDLDYTEVHLQDKKYISQDTLNHWENQLKHKLFVRVHKSYLINVAQIFKISGNTVYLSGKISIPIGRAYKDRFLTSYVKHTSTN